MEKLTALRIEIDEIDKQLIELLQKRLDVSKKIAEEKKRTGREIYDPKREAAKLASVGEAARAEYGDSVTRTFSLLMEESKRIQRED